jgi:hypothetical protein
MPNFRKKPVEIEAREVPTFPGTEGVVAYVEEVVSLAQWCGGTSYMMINEEDERGGENRIEIPTLEGTMFARPGDWIIRGVQGEFYPCKPDIFATTYEPVETMGCGPECAEMHTEVGRCEITRNR